MPKDEEVGAIRIELLGHVVIVAGLRDVVVEEPAALIEDLRAREELKGLSFQLLDAGLVAGPEHLLIAVLNALRALELGLNVASDLGLEILTFASGQRQISRAIEVFGLKPGRMDVALVVIARSEDEARRGLEALLKALGGTRDDSVLEVDERKARALMKAFGIGGPELSSCRRFGPLTEVVKALVMEKVALSMAYR